MSDIRNVRLLYAKGVLFVLLGGLAGAMLVIRAPGLINAALLAISIWAFARAYYFAFYVIEHYVDPGFRFAGLIDFARYAIGRPRVSMPTPPSASSAVHGDNQQPQ
jgi:hypothetical protein